MRKLNTGWRIGWVLALATGFFALHARAAAWPAPGPSCQEVNGDEPAPAPGQLTPGERLEMEHLIEGVTDERLDPDRRQRAALILLQRGWPEATTQLRRLLVATADRPTREAIQLAIAATDRPDDSLIAPLLEQLNSTDADVRASAPAALSRFDRPEVTEKLTAIATDAEADAGARVGAIAALSGHRKPAVLQTLVALADDDPAEVADAAMAAMRRLTGREDIEGNIAAWRAYAQRVKAAPDHDWPAAWTRNLAQAGARLRRAMDEQTRRLSDAYDRLYNETDEARRPALLLDMLSDDTTALRLLAVDLIERRIVNAQPVGDDVRTALRGSLSDRESAVRERAALLLRDLKDAEGAERAVLLLADEPEATVKAAYLALMARVPRAEAVGPSLAAMNDTDLRSAAAGVLVAAADAELLSAAQAAQALATARRELKNNDAPQPPLIRLLGRLGEASDASTLSGLLAHKQSSVRVAAAEQIALDRWPLDPLLERLNDESLRPVVIAAATRRGETATHLQALLTNKPEDASALEAWQAAVKAVAGRLTAADVAATDRWLTDREPADPAHESVLLAASANGPNGSGTDEPAAADARRREAALRLADYYLRRNEPAKAKPVLTKLTEREDLPAADQQRLTVAQVRLLLAQGLVDEASAQTKAALESQAPPSADALSDAWLGAAEAAEADDRPAAAGKFVVAASELLRGQMSPASRQRLDGLIARLKADTPPDPTPPPTPPTPKPPAGS